jgi:hypothetical protein
MRRFSVSTSLACALAAASMTLVAAAPQSPAARDARNTPSTRTAPVFYDDDPIARAADTQDASKAAPREISLVLDAVVNLLGRPG